MIMLIGHILNIDKEAEDKSDLIRLSRISGRGGSIRARRMIHRYMTLFSYIIAGFIDSSVFVFNVHVLHQH